MSILQTLLKYESLFDQKIKKYAWQHPKKGFFILFFIVPFGILVSLCLFTAFIALITTSLFSFI